jgi:hypothetical protein
MSEAELAVDDEETDIERFLPLVAMGIGSECFISLELVLILSTMGI